MAEPIPLNDRMTRVGAEVHHRVGPLLESISSKVGDILGAVRGGRVETSTGKPNGANGHTNVGYSL